MSLFIILVAYHGDTADLRLDVRQQNAKIEEILGKVGAREVASYWTAGAFDYVLVAEFPSVEQAAACAVAIRADMNADATVLTWLDVEATATAVEAARPATGRGGPATGRPATGRDA